jgi:hypothetical protein
MAGDDLGGADRLVEQLAVGHDAADEAAALGLLGVHDPAGKAHLHRLRLADEARQALRAAGAGHDADLDLGLAEARLVGGEDEVAHHRQLAAAAEGEAVHRGDHGLARAGDALPVAGEEVLAVRLGVRS